MFESGLHWVVLVLVVVVEEKVMQEKVAAVYMAALTCFLNSILLPQVSFGILLDGEGKSRR